MASPIQQQSNCKAACPTLPRVNDLEMSPVAPSDGKEGMSTVGRTSAAVKSNEDPFLVDFDQPFDSANPKDWPSSRKWAITNSLSASGFNRIMVSTIMAPALPTIQSELNMTPTESTMALCIYLLATAVGPLIIGPLSEMYGRKRILHMSNAWFLVWNIVCGFSSTNSLLIAARFMAGFGASAIYSVGGGVLGDTWRPEERGKGLTTFLTISILGSAVGPIVGGFMVGRASWRWMFWSTSIFQALMTVATWTTIRETYAPFILRRRAESLRDETGNPNYSTVYERLENNKSVVQVFRQSLSRPLRLLAFHRSLQIVAIMQGFNYGLLYIVLSRFATVWIEQYGDSVEISSLHYISCALGEIVGSQVGGWLMDILYKHKTTFERIEREHAPELRIPLIYPGALLAPIGILIYGWASQYRVQWIVVDIGTFVYMFASQISGLPLQAYIIDAYPEHTGSALAASQVLRSLTAFGFPLLAPSMYGALGYGWGNCILALFGLVLGITIPLYLHTHGARLRERAGGSL